VPPICCYCNKPSKKVTGKDIYPHRKDLHSKIFYACSNCKAYVGCHGGTDKPLGRLADAKLRRAKNEAHTAFDALWRNRVFITRKQAYTWLSEAMGVTEDLCHIGMFDVDQCAKVAIVSYRKMLEATGTLTNGL
jgi:hypothetical protein